MAPSMPPDPWELKTRSAPSSGVVDTSTAQTRIRTAPLGGVLGGVLGQGTKGTVGGSGVGVTDVTYWALLIGGVLLLHMRKG